MSCAAAEKQNLRHAANIDNADFSSSGVGIDSSDNVSDTPHTDRMRKIQNCERCQKEKRGVRLNWLPRFGHECRELKENKLQ